MNARTFSIAVCFLTAGCTLPQTTPGDMNLNALLHEASGALMTLSRQAKDAYELGTLTVDEAKRQAASAASRARKIQEGMAKIQEGKRLIEEGMSGSGSQKK